MTKLSFVGLSFGLVASAAHAMDLDWSGQFRAENHFVKNYTMDGGRTPDPARAAAGGYYIQPGGSDNAHFQTLFLKLRPKLVVNDNVYIKSEWWLGDPVFGFFGNAAPSTTDQRQYYSNQSRGSIISAQRFWAELLTDVGTVQVGRAPLQWGLGLIWNAGDGLWDRYESTGDLVRLVSKFGAFSITPSVVKYSMGNNIGGANPCTVAGVCGPVVGGGGVSEYSLALKYENPDEDFEGGVNFIKRIAGAAQDPTFGYLGLAQTGAGMNFNTWDLYGRKRFGKFSLAGELPITSGDIGGLSYSTWAVALEADWKPNETWTTLVKAGHAPGQTNTVGSPTKYRAFYFNPNYKVAMIMFNYQLANFVGPNTQNNPNVGANSLASPWDNPITNANYLSLGQQLHANKWTFNLNLTFAQARETAAPGQTFLNSWQRRFYNNGTTKSQSDSLGWEVDAGTVPQWDENFQFGLDFGLFFPGDYYKFSNTAVDNNVATIFATAFRAGVTF